MARTKKYLIPTSILLLSVSILFSFIEIKNDSVLEQSVYPRNDTDNCDPDLWKYVYNPKRLQVLDKCLTATGIIVESSANEDGDHHMLLKLDPGQEKLLTQKNIKRKSGNLVIEAVCINKVEARKVGSTCTGFINKIQIPKVGDKVKVTGSHVIDTHNGWSEIHPISRIEVQ